MSTYYIKAKFGKLEEIDGNPLEQGVNAFTNIDQIASDLQEGDTVVFLDGKVNIDDSTIPAGVNVFSSNNVDYYVSDVTFKAAGSLSVKDRGSENSFYNFKDVNITDSNVSEIIGGELIETEKEKADGTGKWTDEVKASGKATVTGSSISSVAGYSNVTVKDSYVSDLNAVLGHLVGTPEISGDDHYFSTNGAGYYKDEESSTLVAKADSVSGAISKVTTWNTVGSVTVSGAEAGVANICGYSKITLENGSDVDSVYAANGSSKLVQTIKKGFKAVEEIAVTDIAAGSLTLKNDADVGNVYGVKTVSITNGNAGDIEGIADYKYSAKNTYSFDGMEDLFNYAGEDGFYFDESQSLTAEKQLSEKATGSVSVKLDKKADEDITVGNIYNYAKVDIAGYKDYSVSVGDITSECITEKETEDNSKGAGSWLDEYSANGSVTLKDNVSAGNITNFANVTLKNATAGAITAYDFSNVDLGGDPLVAGYYKSQESQSADGSYKIEEEVKATGSVSLDNAQANSIKGYAKVTLKNGSTVDGNIISTENYKKTEAYAAAKDKYTDSYKVSLTNTLTAENSYISGNIENFSTVKLVNTNVGRWAAGIDNEEGNGTGTFSFTVNAKTATEDFYTIGANETHPEGAIVAFKDVTISGVADFKKGNFIGVEVNGAISGSGNLTLKNNVLVQGSIYGFQKVTITTAQVNDSISCDSDAKTSITVSDANISGDIAGYKTVKYTQGDIAGSIFDASDVTLTNTDVIGGVYAQKLTVNGECEIGYYYGTEENDILTIKKGAFMEVEDSEGLYFDEGKDKLVVDGTLLLESALDFNEIGLESLTGSGVIAASRDVYEATTMLEGSKVKFVNLGNTSNGFAGEAAEKADNTAKKAAEADWDMYEGDPNLFILDGWLSKGTDIEDTCDWIKFTAQNDGVVSFFELGEADTLTVNGEQCSGTFDIVAGTDYKICVTRNEEDSVQYYATMQLS